MPFRVSQWGYSPDPRTPAFGLIGFNFGQLPPWRWAMKTSAALFPFEALNDGVIWQAFSVAADEVFYAAVGGIPDVTDEVLTFRGTLEPSFGNTMRFFCSFFDTGADPEQQGQLLELYPDALKTRSFIMSGAAMPALIPNPLVITPHKWNAD